MHQVVAAALMRSSHEVLLCFRSATRRWYPAVWDFPGGHVERNETPLAALAREVFEEVGVVLQPDALPVAPGLRVREGDLDLSVWAVRDWAGEPVNRAPEEHERVAWFNIGDTVPLALAHPRYREWLATRATDR